jgi:hypothetical protein
MNEVLTPFEEGEQRYEKGDYDGAIAAYTRALEEEPSEGFYFQCRGQAYRMKGEFDRAIVDYTKALSLYDDDEDRAMAYLYRATAYICKSDYHNVMADANAAIKLGHLLKDAYLARGIAYVQLGPMGQGFADWKTAADYGSTGALQKLAQYGINFTPMKNTQGDRIANEESLSLVANGKSTYMDGSACVFEGVNKDGKGKWTFADGDVCECDFIDGKLHGKAKWTFANGDVYEGGFADGRAKLTWADGEVYEGDFVGGERTGKGKRIYLEGDVYEGDYVNGRRNGKGKYTWPDGAVYEGDFVNDKRTGKGKLTYADGTVDEGLWEDGRFLENEL